jgi:hypothetical protein
MLNTTISWANRSLERMSNDLNVDIRAENLLFANPSGESQESFKRWLVNRQLRSRSSPRKA